MEVILDTVGCIVQNTEETKKDHDRNQEKIMEKEIPEQAKMDYASGLLHFAGKEELYQKYLAAFQEDTHLSEAENAFWKEDYNEVFEQIHALKGLAGTLGFSGLFAIASEAVADMRKGEYHYLEEQLKEMREEQTRLRQAIELLLSK